MLRKADIFTCYRHVKVGGDATATVENLSMSEFAISCQLTIGAAECVTGNRFKCQMLLTQQLYATD